MSNDEDFNLSDESHIKSVFDLFKGTKASNEDLLKLFEAKKRLNIRDNDALWLILIIMESYDQNFLSTSEKVKEILVNFPDALECKLNHLLERAELLMTEKLMLDIEKKSVVLQTKLTTDIIELIKLQSKKSLNSSSKIKTKTLIVIVTCCIFSSLLSSIFCIFLLIKLAFN